MKSAEKAEALLRTCEGYMDKYNPNHFCGSIIVYYDRMYQYVQVEYIT